VAESARQADKKFAPAHKTAKARISSEIAKTRAFRGAMRPVTKGRVFVRSMRASMSRSMYILIAFAPPAAKEPPIKVIRIRLSAGHPSSATTIVGTVVMSNNSMIRGFVSAM
jgi:hypothetical protein